MTNAERIANGYPARPETLAEVDAWIADGCDGPEDDRTGRYAWMLGKASAALMLANQEIARLEREVARLSTALESIE